MTYGVYRIWCWCCLKWRGLGGAMDLFYRWDATKLWVKAMAMKIVLELTVWVFELAVWVVNLSPGKKGK